MYCVIFPCSKLALQTLWSIKVFFFLVPYTCEKKGCHWTDYEENKDWGYYSKTDGDCFTCQDSCNKDDNCGSVECGEDYCSWWKDQTCSREEELVALYYTCRKSEY